MSLYLLSTLVRVRSGESDFQSGEGGMSGGSNGNGVGSVTISGCPCSRAHTGESQPEGEQTPTPT